MGELFLWRRAGSSTKKERQSPQWVRMRMDPSLRGTCVTPNNMALSLIHMHCMAHTFDFTGHKVAKTRILSKWLTKLTHLCCVLSLF